MEKTLKIILKQEEECLICSSPAGLEDSVSTDSLLWLDGDDENFISLGDLLCYLLKKEKHYYADLIMCSECTKNVVTSYKFMQKCESNEKAMNKLVIGLKGITDTTLAGLTYGDKAAFIQIDTHKGKFDAFCDTRAMKTISLTLDRFKYIVNSVSNTNNDTKVKDETEASDSSDFDPSDCKDNSGSERKFNCAICGKKFSGKGNLNYHIERVHRPKIFQCTTCDKNFGSVRILKVHLEKSHNHKTCHICGRIFVRMASLKVHIISHSMTLQCEKCMRKFTSYKALLRYQERDLCHIPPNERRNYKCNQCDLKFSAKESLNNHIDFKHRGIAKFVCEICSAKVQSKSRLEEHVRKTHTNDRPTYPCTQCDKVFFTREYIQTHMRMAHTGEFAAKCYYCDAKFHCASERSSHILKEHQEKTFGCDNCNAIFTSQFGVSKHSKQCRGLHARRRRRTKIVI